MEGKLLWNKTSQFIFAAVCFVVVFDIPSVIRATLITNLKTTFNAHSHET